MLIDQTTTGATVLIVDDDPDCVEVLDFDLRRAGFTTRSASGGWEALDLIGKSQVDVVVTDLRMPNGTGIELLAGIRQLGKAGKAVPVVLALSGFTERTVEEVYGLGAEGFFLKPVDAEVLVQGIKQALVPRDQRWRTPPERLDCTLNVRTCGPDLAAAIAVGALGLGWGGLFVASRSGDGLPRVGAVVGLTVAAASDGGQSHLEGSGIVRWTRRQASEGRPTGLGIELSYLSDHCRSKVLDLVNVWGLEAFIPTR